MLQFAVDKKCTSFIYISSMEIYGQPSKEGKTGEQDYGYIDISSVRSCYPEGKRMCECLCTAYASQYGLNVKSARLAQTFDGYSSNGESGICTICEKCNEWSGYCVAYNGHFGRQLCLYKRCRESNYNASYKGKCRANLIILPMKKVI